MWKVVSVTVFMDFREIYNVFITCEWVIDVRVSFTLFIFHWRSSMKACSVVYRWIHAWVQTHMHSFQLSEILDGWIINQANHQGSFLAQKPYWFWDLENEGNLYQNISPQLQKNCKFQIFIQVQRYIRIYIIYIGRERDFMKLTSSGYFLNAGSKRFLQYLWNHIVNTGRTRSRGVELAAFFVLRRPRIRRCDINKLAIIRLWTCGQNAATLSYSWL